MKTITIYYIDEKEALQRYENQCKVSETVSKPRPRKVQYTENGKKIVTDGFAIDIRFWALD